ncbi:hypothetical protein [Helicobacter cetorum]|uniref:hypothetical protein n=1 Tax=Helicobacter cetorum TaxID=138563 RepID=UPI000CF0F4A2|nr:hypothetical protein [Helicobacter cetorum]
MQYTLGIADAKNFNSETQAKLITVVAIEINPKKVVKKGDRVFVGGKCIKHENKMLYDELVHRSVDYLFEDKNGNITNIAKRFSKRYYNDRKDKQLKDLSKKPLPNR